MIKGLYNSAVNMNSRMKNLEIISTNLANINTTGYKREIPFSEYMSREDGVQLKQITDFTEGDLSETGNPFDLAITGNGFFMIQTEAGVELTKNGKFSISEEGYIINDMGDKVLSTNGAVNIYDSVVDKNKPIEITKEGEIKQGELIVDKLLITKVENQEGMRRIGGQNYMFDNMNYEPAAETDYQIHQGYLENSNTNPIVELENMIRVSKDYEASQKMIKAFDSILSQSKEIGRI
ncbi:MAG: flagellar hook basal-body protein [bacterium]